MRAWKLKTFARLRRDVLKFSIAGVCKNAVRLFVFGGLKHLDVVVDVRTTDKEVLPSVIVQVEKAGAPSAAGDAQGGKLAAIGSILEEPAAEVMKYRKRLVGQVDHIDVGQAVIVVVPEIRAHTGDRLAAIQQRDTRHDPDFLE